jgi:hypothetical protein
MSKALTENEIEFAVSQITGSLDLSGIVVSNNMKEVARKILRKEISAESATKEVLDRCALHVKTLSNS